MKMNINADLETRRQQIQITRANLAALVETYQQTREGTPAETVAALVSRLGYDTAAETMAELINSVGEWDGRISPRVRAWAQTIDTAADRANLEKFSIYQPSKIHPAHIDQLGEAMRNYIPAEPVAEPQEEPAEIDPAELLEDLDTGDHGDRLNDYRDSSSYICDAISEIADSDTSIYYSDILNFIRENPEALADVVAEGLYEVRPGTEYDLYKHGQAAEYMTIERDIYEHMRDAVLLCAVDFIRYDLKRETIPAELADLLKEWADEADNNDRMDEIPDKIREYFETAEENED